jgi:hypothetical protein
VTYWKPRTRSSRTAWGTVMAEKPVIEVRVSKRSDKWFTVRCYDVHKSGWVTWQVGHESGLVPPSRWRYLGDGDA